MRKLYWYVVSVIISYVLVIPAYSADPIITQSTTSSTVTTNGSTETTIKSPPPTAVAPSVGMASGSSDLCTVGVSGAVQTQILGISAGSTVRDMNCERLKLSKTLYDMGMKVAAVSTLCQDKRVFDAMMMAGTPCPYDGMIGEEAKYAWKAEAENNSDNTTVIELDKNEKTWLGVGGVASLLLFLL